MGDSAKLVACPGQRKTWNKAHQRGQSGGGKTTEAYRIDRFGSVDGIVLRSIEDPRPGPKEVLMRVRASSLNYGI